jgi:hypothetical protein
MGFAATPDGMLYVFGGNIGGNEKREGRGVLLVMEKAYGARRAYTASGEWRMYRMELGVPGTHRGSTQHVFRLSRRRGGCAAAACC